MIHICLVMVSILSLLCGSITASADTRDTVIERQNIAVTLVPSDHLLIGESTITYAAGTRTVSLRLSPSAAVAAVTVAGATVPYSFAGGILTVDIPETDGQGAIVVSIVYRAVFNDPLPQYAGSSEDPTYGVNGAITAMGTFLGFGAGWYPAPPSLPSTRTIRISAPAGIEALTAGKRVSRRTDENVTHSVWEEGRPVGGLSLCAGPYRIEERRVDGVDLYTYFYPDNATLSGRYLDAATKYLRFYRDLFGPYPFEKFAIVENFFPTGYGFPSFTLLGGSVIRLPFIIDTSFPHEIAHSWWGNAIEVDQSEGNWSEGLATYVADYLLKEKRSEADGRDYRMQALSDYATLVTPENDFPLARFTSRTDPVSRVIGYSKCAMVFHMLRNKIGDQAFFGALSDICRERLYRSVTWGDFIRAFSRRSGMDVASFAKQWLARPGGPQLALSHVMRHREGTGWVVSGSIDQTPPFYDLQLPLRLETSGPAVGELVSISGGTTHFSISSGDEPRGLYLDPDAEVFRVLAPNEIPVTVNSIKASKQLMVVITDNCRADKDTMGRLLESLGQAGVPVIREEDGNSPDRGDHNLMFCGIPKNRSLVPSLPAEIMLHGNGFSVHGNMMSGTDGALFTVLRNPLSSAHFTALFVPLSEPAAGHYAAKITHYGKYSTLVFGNGKIQQKSTTQATGKGSSVVFK